MTVRFQSMDHFMVAVTEIIPTAAIDEDNDGQITIYTGMKEAPNGTIISWDENECPFVGPSCCHGDDCDLPDVACHNDHAGLQSRNDI